VIKLVAIQGVRPMLSPIMARPERFELPTTWFEARYSIQLSYGRLIEGAEYTLGRYISICIFASDINYQQFAVIIFFKVY
jgi:hypothetical protein